MPRNYYHQFCIILLCSISLQLISGLADDILLSGQNAKKASAHNSSSKFTRLKILILCLGIFAIVAFSVFLFKIWQKKKREEQHARLYKLFEDDNDLEVELGMRD